MLEKKIEIKDSNNGGYDIIEKVKKSVYNSGKTIDFWVESNVIKVKTLEEVTKYLEKEV